MEGRKDDTGKLRWELIQPRIVQEYVRVLTKGAEKYEPENWRKVPDQRKRYFAALLRHIWAWWMGERNDPEWGIHHLAHAMCCLAFLAEPELEVPEKEPCTHKHLCEGYSSSHDIAIKMCVDCGKMIE